VVGAYNRFTINFRDVDRQPKQMLALTKGVKQRGKFGTCVLITSLYNDGPYYSEDDVLI